MAAEGASPAPIASPALLPEAASGEAHAQQAAAETLPLVKGVYAAPFLDVNRDCMLTFFCCGFIPIYEMLRQIGAFTAVIFAITPDMAPLWAILFWFGTLFHYTIVYQRGSVTSGAMVIFAACFALFAIGMKRRMQIEEDDGMTLLKACCCPCFLIGQLGATTRAQHGA